MSGLDILQAATSAFAIAELARQTALLVRKVYKARTDAEELFTKTQNLSRLVKNVARILEKRELRRQNGIVSKDVQEIEENIVSSLDMCRVCLEGIRDKLKPFVEKKSDQSKMQLRDRFKFIMQQNYIQSQERNISVHLSYLSVLLSCLQHENQAEQRLYNEEERQNRQASIQYTQEMHEAFLRQLFAFFQYLFRRAEEASFSPDGSAAMQNVQRYSEQAQHYLAIEQRDSRPTLQDIFGSPAQQGVHQQFEEPIYQPDRVVHALLELPAAEEVNNDIQDLDLIQETNDDQRGDEMERTQSVDMTRYASETTFLLAIKQGLTNLVRNLIEDGADTRAKDDYNWTVLHHAVFCLNEKMVDILLTHEKSECKTSEILNAQTKTGETALILAIQRAHKLAGANIAEKLLEIPECDLNISDGQGTALYYAVNEGKPSSKPRRSLIQSMAEKEADVQAVHDQVPESVSNYEFLYKYIQKSGKADKQATRRKSSVSEPHERRESMKTSRRLTLKRFLSSKGDNPDPGPSSDPDQAVTTTLEKT